LLLLKRAAVPHILRRKEPISFGSTRHEAILARDGCATPRSSDYAERLHDNDPIDLLQDRGGLTRR
jgi:hypothetical protein